MMGDATPLRKSTSKYITPCRTFGLKRKFTPKSDPVKRVRSENETSESLLKSVDGSPVIRRATSVPRSFAGPLQSIDNQLHHTPLSTKTKDPRTFVSPLQCGNNDDENQLATTPSRSFKISGRAKIKCSLSNTILEKNESIDHQLQNQIKRINTKLQRIEKLKQEEVYMKKHNLLELQKSTDNWMAAFKEIAAAVQSELQAAGRNCTLLDVLIDHNIPPERVGFNVENLEFE